MATGGDRGGVPEVRALRGEGPGESGGGEIPPLEASACNPADHPIASGRGLANFRVVCSWCGDVLSAGPPGAATTHGMCKPCEAKFIQDSGGLLDHLELQPTSPTFLEAAARRAEFFERLFGSREGGAR